MIIKPPCIIKTITNINCPTCGITRAITELLRFNFKKSYDYNPMAVPVLIGILLILSDNLLKKKTYMYVGIIIVIFNFIFFIINTGYGFVCP